MNQLSPRARALIESAIEHEEGPTAAELGRLRRSVLSGLATSSAVAGAVSATLMAKAAAAAGGTAVQITAYMVAGAIAAGATLAAREQLAGEPTRGAAVATVWNGAARKPIELGGRVPRVTDVPATPTAVSAPNLAHPTSPELAAPSFPAPDVPATNVASTNGAAPNAAPPKISLPSVASSDFAGSNVTAPTVPSDPVPPALSLDTGARAPAAVMPQENALSGTGALTALPTEIGSPASVGAARGRPSAELAQQLAYLHSMRAELHGGNAGRALELSRESEALFAGSSLEAEAGAARIAALCRLGRSADARGAIERFRRVFPSSALLRNVENTCAIGLGKGAGH